MASNECSSQLPKLISVSKEDCTYISNLTGDNETFDSNSSSSNELEVRIGRKEGGSFVPGITSREKWYDLIAYLSDTNLYKAPKWEKTVVYSQGGKRQIQYINIQKEPHSQKKTKREIDGQVIVKEILSFGNYIIRLAASNEMNINWFPSGDDIYKRVRNRVTFEDKNGFHQFDLTHIEKPDKKDVGVEDEDVPSTELYEVEVEYLKVQTVKDFFEPIKRLIFVMREYKSTSLVISDREKLNAIHAFNDAMSDGRHSSRANPDDYNKRLTPQPIDLDRKELPGLVGYSVTNKLNGTRYSLLFTDNGTYLLNSTDVLKIDLAVDALIGTIADVEYFDKQIYAFDLMFYRDREYGQVQDVRGLILPERLKLLNLIKTKKIPDSLKSKFNVKTFLITRNLSAAVIEMLKMAKGMPEGSNDGLIFTPVFTPYMLKKKKEDNSTVADYGIYKWKPPSELTIDFALHKVSESQDGITYQLLIFIADKKHKNRTEWVPFIGNEKHKFNSYFVSSERYKDRSIGEFLWVGDRFILKKIRPDKKEPNFIDVAMNVWRHIHDPIEEEELIKSLHELEVDDRLVRKYHNSIKRELIEEYCGSVMDNSKGHSNEIKKNVLDIGIGRGGDLGKYQAAHVKHLFGVEPSEANLAELENRLKEKNLQSMRAILTLIPTGAEDTNRILGVTGNHMDVVSSFFSLTFFFESQELLRQLIDTIDKTTKQGSYFIGTTMDGESILNVLEDVGRIDTGINVVLDDKGNVVSKHVQYIEKKYTNLNSTFGRQILIDQGTGRIVDRQIEYPAMFNILAEELDKRGFDLINSDFFDPPDSFPDNERRFIKLNRRFVFKKREAVRGNRPAVASNRPAVASKQKPPQKIVAVAEKERSGTAQWGASLAPKVKLSLLTPGVTKSFDTTFWNGLVRTGTIADGACYFHTILTAINKPYRDAEKAKQKSVQEQMAADMRKHVASRVTRELWNSVAKGQIARIGGGTADAKGFDSTFFVLLERYFVGMNAKSNLLSKYDIDTIHQKLSSGKYQDLTVSGLRNDSKLGDPLLNLFIEYTEQFNFSSREKAELEDIVNKVYKEAVDVTYNSFIKNISTLSSWVGQELLQIVGEILNLDIYLLGSDGQPYQTGCGHVNGKRKSIIVLWVGGVHYESVSEKVIDKATGLPVALRTFNPNSEIIKKFQDAIGCDFSQVQEEKE